MVPKLRRFLLGCVALCWLTLSGIPLAGQTTPSDVPNSGTAREMPIDGIKKTVVFLEGQWEVPSKGPTAVPQVEGSIGTGFIVKVPEPRAGSNMGLRLLVTARHMICTKLPDGSAGSYLSLPITARIDTKTADDQGRRWATLEMPVLDKRGDLTWFVDEDDAAADITAAPLVLNEDVADIALIGPNLFATSEVVKREHVNENDEVLFAGLFSGYVGEKKNYPIVRHGRIALMTDETFVVDKTRPDNRSSLYLLEVSSFGGNSGSPVFLRLGGVRETTGTAFSGYSYYLLGVMHGYLPDVDTKQNSGIALVVPIDKLNEILQGNRYRAYASAESAKVLMNTGDLAKAEGLFQESIGILEKGAPDSSLLASTLDDYAVLLRQAHRAVEAQTKQLQAQNIRSHRVATPNTKVPACSGVQR